MSTHPTDGDRDPEAVDQVLSILSNRGRSAVVLTPEEERLLDEWVEGQLTPDAAERAATLTRQNALAAEHVLERRLLKAAQQGPAVPQGVTERILKINTPPRTSASGGWWRALGRWRWTAIAGAAALASIVAVVGLPLWQQTMRGSGSIQVAMVTIDDRNPLFEPSDVRMRGSAPQPGPVVEQRFRDVEVPTSILKGLLATAAAPHSAAAREIEPYLSISGDGRPSQVVVDSALKQKIEAVGSSERMFVRIYDLEDPRAADVRPLVGPLPKGRRTYLLTLKP